MTSTNTLKIESQTSKRLRMSGRRWIMTVAAVALLAVAGSVAAQIPALPIAADHRSDIATPVGSIQAAKQSNVIQACADLRPSVSALPVGLPIGLPVQIPTASAKACAGADLDQLKVRADARANTYGVADPTGLLPSYLKAGAGADVDDKSLDLEAGTDSHAAQGVLDTITGAVKSAWGTVRGLF